MRQKNKKKWSLLLVILTYLSNEVYTNKLVLCSELMIFIKYEDNSYHFICYVQENVIFCSTHTIFDEEFFSKYTDSHAKEYILYNKLLDKISLETKLLVSRSFDKDGPSPVFIPHNYIPPIQNNSSSYSLYPFILISFYLSYLL